MICLGANPIARMMCNIKQFQVEMSGIVQTSAKLKKTKKGTGLLPGTGDIYEIIH